MPTTIQAVKTEVFANRCGDNLLNKNLTFDLPFSANIVSGSGVANTSTDITYSGARSLYINNLDATDTLVISGGGTNWYNDYTGSYVLGVNSVLQFSVYNSNGLPQMATGRVRVFFDTFEIYTIEFSSETAGQWETFYATIPFNQNIDFIIELDATNVAGTECYFDGLKWELDDKNSNNPSPYTGYVPKEFFTSLTIDVPSITSNDYATVTATLTGAIVGDYVQMTYPAELITLGLVVSVPIVTADDEIKFLVHNHSGGAINPASGTYTFKITR